MRPPSSDTELNSSQVLRLILSYSMEVEIEKSLVKSTAVTFMLCSFYLHALIGSGLTIRTHVRT